MSKPYMVPLNSLTHIQYSISDLHIPELLKKKTTNQPLENIYSYTALSD